MIKIAYFGTGDFSKNILGDLHTNYSDTLEIVYTVSQPDKPVGRKRIMQATPVHAYAEAENMPCLQPDKIRKNTDFHSQLQEKDLDFIIVVAYGKIIPQEILDIPRYGCINIHGSILPKYRGASPIQASIKDGATTTGLTIMYMSAGMDEGDILQIREVDIDKDDKTPDIFRKFESIGPELLIDTLPKIISGDLVALPQDHSAASYCGKIEKQDGEIDFSRNTAAEIYNRYRAYSPWPGIFSFYEGKKLSIEDCVLLPGEHSAEIGTVVSLPDSNEPGIVCQGGVLILRRVKLEGKNSMDILSFINGNQDFLDYKF